MHEPDFLDFIMLVEEETIEIKNLIFSRNALHEYTKYPEKSTHMKAKKLKNCYIKADENNEMAVEHAETVARRKDKLCDGNYNLDDCQFYHEITVDDQNIFLKKNRLCYGCYADISRKHTA